MVNLELTAAGREAAARTSRRPCARCSTPTCSGCRPPRNGEQLKSLLHRMLDNGEALQAAARTQTVIR